MQGPSPSFVQVGLRDVYTFSPGCPALAPGHKRRVTTGPSSSFVSTLTLPTKLPCSLRVLALKTAQHRCTGTAPRALNRAQTTINVCSFASGLRKRSPKFHRWTPPISFLMEFGSWRFKSGVGESGVGTLESGVESRQTSDPFVLEVRTADLRRLAAALDSPPQGLRLPLRL